MRRPGPPLLLSVLLLLSSGLSGCGRSSLQESVDRANVRQIQRAVVRYYVMMMWDDTPKDWLLITDAMPAPLGVMNSMLIYHQQKLSVSSRLQVIEGTDITPADGGVTSSHQERLFRYQQSRQEVGQGKKWVSSSRTTSIHPFAADYRPAGTITFRGRPVELMVAEVYSPRAKDPLAVYEYVQVLVGLDPEKGDLVLEYIVNLQPRPDAANRLLTVQELSGRVGLSRLQQMEAEERLAIYGGVYTELRELAEVLDRKVAEIKPIAG